MAEDTVDMSNFKTVLVADDSIEALTSFSMSTKNIHAKELAAI